MDKNFGRLVRIDPNFVSNPVDLKPTMGELEHEPQILKDLWYPVGLAQPSCIRLPQIDVNFKIKSQIINMLPKFIKIDDTYIFMREFEEVCTTMRLQQLTEDAVKLRLINFALKDSAKK